MLVETYQSLAIVLDIKIHINNEPLKQIIASKYLGMKIDSNLKWDDHINAIIPKISSKIWNFKIPKKGCAHRNIETSP